MAPEPTPAIDGPMAPEPTPAIDGKMAPEPVEQLTPAETEFPSGDPLPDAGDGPDENKPDDDEPQI